MTKNKAQKRAVRARMVKTGERYTTARHYHLDLHRQQSSPPPDAGTEPEPRPAALPPCVAEPGMSDAAVRRGTGKTWDEWFVLLDA